MPEMLFCYCCRVHHPKKRMRLFPTRVGYRWRCISSIEAATRNIPERDLFGQRQTAANREASKRLAKFATQFRRMRSHLP